MDIEQEDQSTAKITRALLKLVAGGAILGLALVAPNILQVLDKPSRKYFSRLDQTDQERAIRRAMYYARRRGLLSVADTYEHGMRITDIGVQYLQTTDLENLSIPTPKQWDRKWRIVFYDIPESHRAARRALIAKLRDLGFYQLQRSVLVFPYPCRPAIEAVVLAYQIQKYISYVETDHIDQQTLLFKHFPFLKEPLSQFGR